MSAELEAALARAEAACARAVDAVRTEGPDPAVVAALAAAADSSAEPGERSIAERVDRGLLGWDEVWRDPFALGPDGVRLVQRAVVLVAQELGDALL